MVDTFKGHIQIQIDPLETEAKLVFTKDINGTEWTREKVYKLLKDKSIIESINPLTLEKALKSFTIMQGGTKSMIIAHGVPPKPPKNEEIEWQELTVPESLKIIADSMIKSAPNPLVYDVTVKRIRVEKQIATKKVFPFISRKKQKDMVWEDRKVKQKATIDPKIIKTAYAEKGNLIAKITPFQAGLPGRSITGNPVPPPEPRRAKIYYGDGISQEGREIYADISGFLRIGENWVDIIPFQHSQIKVYLSPDKTDCLLDFSYSEYEEQEPRYYVKIIYKQAQELGIQQEELLTKQRLEEIIENAIHYKAPLKAFSVCKEIDYVIKLTVSEDKLKATLSLKKGRGQNKKLKLTAISKAIKDAKLKQMNLERVKRDILEFYKGKNKVLNEYFLAEGMPPAKGEQGKLSWELDFLSPEKSEKIKQQLEQQETTDEIIKSLKEYPVSLVQEIAEVVSEQKLALFAPPGTGEPGVDVYGKAIPGIKGDEYALKLFENLKMHGYFVVATAKGILEKGEKDGVILLRIRSHQDAMATVSISKDKMQAFLTIIAPKGSGRLITLPEVEKIIKEQGVIEGVIPEAVKQAVSTAKERIDVKELLIAEGKAPLHAKGKRFIFKVEMASGKSVKIRADGRADYRFKDNITIVKKGDLLAEIAPGENEPIDGISVTGQTIPAKKMADAIMPVCRNVYRKSHPDGSIKIFAQTDGELIYNKDILEVKKMLFIKGDVGLKTGNIRFPGSVFIRGSVLSGFSVFAEGDISVGNIVEEALLSADGSVKINKGIKGSGKAILRTKKNISCQFVENAVILAVGEIKINRACLRSSVKCNDKLVLGLEKGTIIGGNIKVKKGLILCNLGAASGVKTEISFGQDYLIGEQIELAERESEKLKKGILDYDRKMKEYKKSNISNLEELAKIRTQKFQDLKTIESINLRLFTLREKFEEHFPAEIIVNGTVYPGVIIESHGRKLLIEREKSEVKYVFNQRLGRIEEKLL